jgi:hypothetical protein
MFVSEPEQVEVCKICGNKKISSFHSYSRGGKGRSYCSFKCSAIGERHRLMIISLAFLCISIACIVLLALKPEDIGLEQSIVSIVVSTVSFIITALFLFYCIFGYITNYLEGKREENLEI